MPSPFAEDTPDYSETFAADTAADIGAELGFGQVKEVEDAVVIKDPIAAKPVETTTSEETPPEPRIVEGQNSANAKPLPKSWKKDMAPLWEKADPALHEYVYTREADVMRGIQQYQRGHQQWDNLIKPFAPIFEQHPDVNPVQLMQGLMQSHLQLLNPSLTAEKKTELFQRLARDYGVNFSPSGEPAAQPNPEVAALRQQLHTIQQTLAQQQTAAYNSSVEQQLQAINAFAADPKNIYFDEVGNDIYRFIQTGAAQDLASAYELACYANPAVRAKMLAAQQQPAGPVTQPRAGFKNIEGDTPKPVRTRKGSIDDTIDAIVSNAYSKH